jgi:two-component system chemotaxis response regulator CheY
MGPADLSIYLVEPSETQWKIISNRFEEILAKDIQWFRNGEDVLQAMKTTPPDLVVSAMHLPDMTGCELVELMRKDESLNDTLFMLVSSETSYRYLEPIRQSGAVALLPKPFEVKDLERALANTVDLLSVEQLIDDIDALEDVRVLIVDDSITSRNAVRRVLENAGVINIVEAVNGKEAIATLESNYFDIIFTDYAMPEMDGEALVKYIREESSQRTVPIVMVTSSTDQTMLSAIEQAGVTALSGKPFEANVIKNVIKRLLD